MVEVSEAPSNIGTGGRYHVLRALGKFGRVKLAYDKREARNVAIRFIERETATNVKYIEKEILSRRAMYHHHIITLQEVFLGSDALCIVMGYAPGGNLLDFVNQHRYLNEDWARRFFQQLIIAVAYNQHRGVKMKDIITLDNILLTENQQMICLCDLKLKEAYSPPPTVALDHPYSPPEIEVDQSKHADVQKSDIYSCGVCLYYMLFGRFPGKNGALRLPECFERTESETSISSDCKDFLIWVLSTNPEHRPTIDEVIKCAWFQKYLPEGTEEYNEGLKNVSKKVVEAALGLQSESEVRMIIREAPIDAPVPPPQKPIQSLKIPTIEVKWFCPFMQLLDVSRAISMKCKWIHQPKSQNVQPVENPILDPALVHSN